MIRMEIKKTDNLISALIIADNKTEVNEFKATLSKALRGSMFYGHFTGELTWDTLDVDLSANGVNGGVNEAGLKRVEMLIKKAKAFGIDVPEIKTVASDQMGWTLVF